MSQQISDAQVSEQVSLCFRSHCFAIFNFSDVFVTCLLSPFTIRNQETVRFRNEDSKLKSLINADIHIQGRADLSCFHESTSHSRCFFTSRKSVLST